MKLLSILIAGLLLLIPGPAQASNARDFARYTTEAAMQDASQKEIRKVCRTFKRSPYSQTLKVAKAIRNSSPTAKTFPLKQLRLGVKDTLKDWC